MLARVLAGIAVLVAYVAVVDTGQQVISLNRK